MSEDFGLACLLVVNHTTVMFIILKSQKEWLSISLKDYCFLILFLNYSNNQFILMKMR
jgi:hypothetical protein